MKKVLLLFGRQSVISGDADPARLAQLLNDTPEEIRVDSACFEDLLFSMSEEGCDVVNTNNNASLTEYNIVYLRYWGNTQGHAIAVTHFCRQKDIPFVDKEAYRQGSFNKITQYINLFEAQVAFPRTLIADGEQLLARYIEHSFVFPLIIKSISGTRGKDNYLVHDEAEMREILTSNSHLLFALQEFVPNNGDYRVIVMGNKVVSVIERKASGDTHLNNTSQGGSARIVENATLPPEVLEASVRAAQYFGRDIAGVDMVKSKADGRYYCFEVNRAPQIEHSSFETEKAKLLAAFLSESAS